jgi:hypothetical protein
MCFGFTVSYYSMCFWGTGVTVTVITDCLCVLCTVCTVRVVTDCLCLETGGIVQVISNFQWFCGYSVYCKGYYKLCVRAL